MVLFIKKGVAMPQNNKLAVKTIKTAELFGLVNLVISPLYLFDTSVGLAVSTAVNAFLLYQLHELGKSRRPGSNRINTIRTFFSSQTNSESLEVDNAVRNLINGGDAIYDELALSFK
jgi:hypothetical protein